MAEKVLTEVLQMEFKDWDNKIRKLKLANPREDLTEAEIEEVMNIICESEYFGFWREPTPYKAKIIKTEVSEIVTVS